MILNDIVFLKSVNPVTIEESPSLESKEFASKFIVGIEVIRKQYGLPEKALDIRQFIGTDLFDPEISEYNLVLSSLKIIANSIKGTTGLDDSVVDQILLITYFNACIDLRYFNGFVSLPIQFLVGRKEIVSTIVDYPKEVGAIIVPFLISKTSLIKWIKDNWKSINKQIDDHMTTNPAVLKVHKNTELVTEIFDLKDKQNKTFEEVADCLHDKYPNIPKTASVEWIKRMYYYHQKFGNFFLNSIK